MNPALPKPCRLPRSRYAAYHRPQTGNGSGRMTPAIKAQIMPHGVLRIGVNCLLATGRSAEGNPDDETTWADTPRNAPCPSPSGKKYRLCHGRFG